MPNQSWPKIFEFIQLANHLKETYRYSARNDAKDIHESVADHCYLLALLVFLVCEELKLELDVLHAIKIALVHDIAESITGDIDVVRVHDGEITKEEKNAQEQKAIAEIQAKLPPALGEEIYSLWQEYELAETREGKLVKALDKLEVLIYLVKLGNFHYDRPEYIPNHADQVVANFPELQDFLKLIKEKLKAEFTKGGFEWKEEYD